MAAPTIDGRCTLELLCGRKRFVTNALSDEIGKGVRPMHRHLLIAFLFFVGCTALACKSYTAGLQQSVTQVDETVAITALHTISLAQRNYSVSNGGRYGTFEQLVQSGYL